MRAEIRCLLFLLCLEANVVAARMGATICLKQCTSSSCLIVLLSLQVGAACLTDLTAAEEACCSASLQAAVGSDGSLCGITKQGQAAFSADLLLV